MANANDIKRKMREAQPRAEQQIKHELDKVNRANQRSVNEHNRKVDAHNRKVTADHNGKVKQHNRKAEALNRKVIDNLNRQLRSATSSVRYTQSERQLADRVYGAVGAIDPREYDCFLSYARIDGADVGNELRNELETLGVAVWFDEVAIVPGRSQSLQMDAGLR